MQVPINEWFVPVSLRDFCHHSRGASARRREDVLFESQIDVGDTLRLQVSHVCFHPGRVAVVWHTAGLPKMSFCDPHTLPPSDRAAQSAPKEVSTLRIVAPLVKSYVGSTCFAQQPGAARNSEFRSQRDTELCVTTDEEQTAGRRCVQQCNNCPT